MEIIYDNSQLQEFKNCQYRYWLHYGLGYKKRQEGVDEHDKNFGTAIHAGLETHYKGGDLGSVIKAFSEAYPTQLSTDDNAKTQENGIKILQEYIKHYQEQDKKFKVLACEETDTFEIAPGVNYRVKIDLIVENTEQGGVYVIDHKTTGKSFDYRYWSQFEPNSQLTGYSAYAQKRFKEAHGAMINGIRLGYRQRKYLDSPAGFYYEFQRQLFNRSKNQIEAWKRDVLHWVALLTLARENNRWGKNMSQCTYCSYRPICLAEWDPLTESDRDCIEIQYDKVDPYEYLKKT